MGRKSKNRFTFKNKQLNKPGKTGANNILATDKSEKLKKPVSQISSNYEVVENPKVSNKTTLKNIKIANKANNIKIFNGNADSAKEEIKEYKDVYYLSTPFFNSPMWFRAIVEELAKELHIYPDLYKPF